MFKVVLATCCDLKPHTDVLNGTKVAFTFLWKASLLSQQESIGAMGRKRTFFLLHMKAFDATCPAIVSPASASEEPLSSHFYL